MAALLLLLPFLPGIFTEATPSNVPYGLPDNTVLSYATGRQYSAESASLPTGATRIADCRQKGSCYDSDDGEPHHSTLYQPAAPTPEPYLIVSASYPNATRDLPGTATSRQFSTTNPDSGDDRTSLSLTRTTSQTMGYPHQESGHTSSAPQRTTSLGTGYMTGYHNVSTSTEPCTNSSTISVSPASRTGSGYSTRTFMDFRSTTPTSTIPAYATRSYGTAPATRPGQPVYSSSGWHPHSYSSIGTSGNRPSLQPTIQTYRSSNNTDRPPSRYATYSSTFSGYRTSTNTWIGTRPISDYHTTHHHQSGYLPFVPGRSTFYRSTRPIPAYHTTVWSPTGYTSSPSPSGVPTLYNGEPPRYSNSSRPTYRHSTNLIYPEQTFDRSSTAESPSPTSSEQPSWAYPSAYWEPIPSRYTTSPSSSVTDNSPRLTTFQTVTTRAPSVSYRPAPAYGYGSVKYADDPKPAESWPSRFWEHLKKSFRSVQNGEEKGRDMHDPHGVPAVTTMTYYIGI